MERMMFSSSPFSNGLTPTTSNHSNSNEDSSELHTRFQAELDNFNRSDVARNDLMKRLLQENSSYHDKVSRLENDLESERQSRRHHQDEAKSYRLRCERAINRTDNDPFCLVLIDGDGCIFHERLLKAGADGGAEAAHILKQEVSHQLHEKGVVAGCNIMVQIYMSLEDLARKLAYVGILNTQGDMKAFEQAFCNAQALFSIVDVGRGKERADHKIKEMFRLFVNNSHCKHIIFGGCHDNGYLPNLYQYSKDASVAGRLTLLETTPAEYQYRQLGFDIQSFPGVFRNTPLPERRMSPVQPPAKPMSPAANNFIPASGNVFSNSPSPAGRNPTPPSIMQLPIGTGKPFANIPDGATSPGLATASTARQTYANVGGPSDAKTVDVKPLSKPQKKYIVYNRDNMRLDPKLKEDLAAETRLKGRVASKGKLCNNYHLKGQCWSGASCDYSHEPPLSEGEKIALRKRARTTPCKKGSLCEDYDCYLGHNCPFGSEMCALPDCKFGEYHGMDLKPDYKYYEDGDVDPCR